MMLILSIAVFWVVFKLCMLGIRLTWGIFRFLFSILIFPAIIFALVAAGLVYLAVPILAIVGLFALLHGRATA